MLEGDGFAGFSKRSLDALEGNGFGLDKRVPSKSQHESRLRRAIDNLNRIRAQALAERLKRSTYNLRMQRTVKRALDALEGNDAFGF
ncbi:hypothetical protein Ddc_03620 [Ditylenchus destructor]|nr:hypothetical protein Ddc_03620 [Ditylenchus destructor]